MYLGASSHSSSLLLYRNHIKLSYISQRLALKHMGYSSCYTVIRTCELYKSKRSLHMCFTTFYIPMPVNFPTCTRQAVRFIPWSQNHFHPFILPKLSCPFSSVSKNLSCSQPNLGFFQAPFMASLLGIPQFHLHFQGIHY